MLGRARAIPPLTFFNLVATPREMVRGIGELAQTSLRTNATLPLGAVAEQSENEADDRDEEPAPAADDAAEPPASQSPPPGVASVHRSCSDTAVEEMPPEVLKMMLQFHHRGLSTHAFFTSSVRIVAVRLPSL